MGLLKYNIGNYSEPKRDGVRLQQGKRLRIDISSSDFLPYNIHSNHAGDWAVQTETKVALQNILYGGEFASVIRIPQKV